MPEVNIPSVAPTVKCANFIVFLPFWCMNIFLVHKHEAGNLVLVPEGARRQISQLPYNYRISDGDHMEGRGIVAYFTAPHKGDPNLLLVRHETSIQRTTFSLARFLADHNRTSEYLRSARFSIRSSTDDSRYISSAVVQDSIRRETSLRCIHTLDTQTNLRRVKA